MKIKLVTFADGSRHWRDAARRLSKQARKSGCFSEVEVWTLARLQREREDFWVKNKDLLLPHVKGFGFWLWKPFIILDALTDPQADYDLLVYLDAGCTLNLSNPASMKRFNEYCHLAHQNDGLAFQLRDQTERAWNKMDTILAVGADEAALSSNQLVAGISMFRRSSYSSEIVEKWLMLSLAQNYHLLDDTPSTAPNSEVFISHRHDQSIWSLLVKKSSFAILPDETYFGGAWSGQALNFPFLATRNSTGFTSLSQGFWWKLARRLTRTLRR